MKTQLKKALAMFMLLAIINQVFFPTMAFALMAGATSPEATSFEPIDTTDMVNPLTGDFTYSIPMIEIPGPEGSYPLALSYHAGIQPNEEASWVGLGWSLNPGAIARNVNGYPDDWKQVGNNTRTYWSGGNTKTLSVDVGFWAGIASVNAGLQFSQDTYRGFGVGWHVTVSKGILPEGLAHKLKVNPGVQLTIGISPYGETYAELGLSVSEGKNLIPGVKLGGQAGLSTNFKSVETSFSAGLSIAVPVDKQNSLGLSIGTPQGRAKGTFGGGFSTVHNSTANRVSTETTGWNLSLDFGVFDLGVHYRNVRYWTDESQYVMTNGALYGRNSIAVNEDMDLQADDNYYLPDSKNENLAENPDGNKQAGGVFPNTDDYNVAAQGVGGAMSPYDFQSVLYTQNTLDSEDASKDVYQDRRGVSTWYVPNSKKQFRFNYDFSNSFRQATTTYDENSYEFGQVTPSPVDGTPGYENTVGYDSNTNRLEGSKHIEYFTNKEINLGTAKTKGFVNCQSKGFVRPDNDQIGGFMITNSSGVTYHFALPAYSRSEEVYTEKVSRDLGLRWNKLTRPEAYAYTWYLTAVTGPDYVDRGTEGLSDDDWGYWVQFRYGLWTPNYNWTNPGAGYDKDIDNEFQTATTGIKEIYYLDAVKTRTHTALFEKELRADSKNGFRTYENAVPFNIYKPMKTSVCNEIGSGCADKWNFPVPTLKLKNIYLVKNDQLSSTLEAMTGTGGASGTFTYTSGVGTPPGPPKSETVTVFNAENVLDVGDNQSAALTAKCIRKTVFNYDYSLTPNTPNSKDPDGTWYTKFPSNIDMLPSGKLTLLSVDFQGRGGEQLQPPTEFSYDLDPSDINNQVKFSVSSIPGTDKKGTITLIGSSTVQDGEILRFVSGNQTYYCTVLKASAFVCNVLYLDLAPTAVSNGLVGFRTKNPPYNQEAFDMWGAYKSDFTGGNNENLARQTTAVSNVGTDAWCLRKIKSDLGAEVNIKYEGDTYNRSVLNENRSLIASAVTPLGANTIRFTINDVDPSTIYHVGDVVNAIVYKQMTGTGNPLDDAVSLKGLKVTAISGNQVSALATGSVYAALMSVPPGTGLTSVALPTANLTYTSSVFNYGGGIRVKSISINDLSGSNHTTSYNYGLPGFEGQVSSSGVTSFEPVRFDTDNMGPYSTDAKKVYRKLLYKNMNYLLALGKEVPPPAVLYEYVSMQDSETLPNNDETVPEGKILYQYTVYNANMFGIKEELNQVTPVNALVDSPYGPENYYIYNLHKKNMRFKDFTTRLGNLKRTIIYDNLGNKLSESINHYLHEDLENKSFEEQAAIYEGRLSAYDGVNYNYQGVIQQRFGNARMFATTAPAGGYFLKGDRIMIMNSREVYPVIQTGSTIIDYKNGNKIDQKNLGYDYYSGEILKALSYDTYGNRTINETFPAYRVPAYSKMGLKTTDNTNKHMLTQEATNYVYSADQNNNYTGVISADAQTWSNAVTVLDPDGAVTTVNQAGIWRPQTTLKWLPAGNSPNSITPLGSFTAYFATGGTSNPSWKKVNDISIYNVYSAALEASDLNTDFATTHKGYNNSRTLITGGPARYYEIAYTSAEDGLLTTGSFSGGITKGSGTINTDSLFAHTGSKSLKVLAGQSGFIYTIPFGQFSTTTDFTAAVWVKSASGAAPSGTNLYYKVGGGTAVTPTQTYTKSAAGWYLLEITLPYAALTGNLEIGCKNAGSDIVYFDDFRFQPSGINTQAFVYDDATGQLNYILSSNNLYVRYQYDGIGRLVRTYKEVLGKNTIPVVNAIRYNHGKLAKAKWVNTGNSQCHQINGNTNGFLDFEQKDLNTKSPTYNQTRWVTSSTESPSCPKTAYAKLVPHNGIVTGSGGYQYSDYTVNFYSDPEMTLPTTLTASASINVRITQSITDAASHSFSNTIDLVIPASSGQSSVSMNRVILSRCGTNSTSPYPGGSASPSGGVQPYCMNNSVTLQSGTGYIN